MKSIFTPVGRATRPSVFDTRYGLTDDIRVKAVRDALFTSVSKSAIKHNVGKTTIRNWMQRMPVSYLLESERKKEK